MTKIVVESPLQVLSRFNPATELDFERQVLRCTEPLFPGYAAGLWKPRIRDPYGRGAQPDMVLVSRDLGLWYVVELEFVSHSVTGHVRPQLETLGQGIYDSALIPSLRDAVPDVPEGILADLVYKEPGLLCIADGYSERLKSACSDNGFELCVLEPHRGDNGGWALSATHLASPMTSPISVNRYQLRRGKTLGDKEFLGLPGHFPVLAGSVYVLGESGDYAHECLVHRSDSGVYLLLPTSMAPRDRPLSLTMIDRGQRKLRLEVM